MIIVSTARQTIDGPRRIWIEDVVSDFYDRPGVEFRPPANHDFETDLPAVDVPDALGEQLVRLRYDVEALDESDEGGAETSAAPADADPADDDLDARIDSAGYETLRSAAGHLDEVSGNQSADELRTTLKEIDETRARQALNAANGEP